MSLHLFYDSTNNAKGNNIVLTGYILKWTVIMLSVEFLLTVLLHYRQYTHLGSLTRIPNAILRYGNGIYTVTDLELSKQFGINRSFRDAARKVYTILAWMVVIQFKFLNYGWSLATHMSLVWPNFLGPIIACNMSFAVISFTAYQIFRIPILACKASVRGGLECVNSNAILAHLKTWAVNLLPVGIAAGFLTSFLQTLEAQSLAMQVCVLGSFSGLFILAYPTLEVWHLIQNLKDESRRRRSSEEAGRHKRILYKLCEQVGFSKKNVIIVESQGGSAMSTFYFGFLFYRKIVVFLSVPVQANHNHPTPAEMESIFTPAEVEALFAHELGHWYYVHSDKAVILWHILQISTVILTYWLYSNPFILNAFGFRLGPSKGLPVASAFYMPGVIIVYCLFLRQYYYILEVACNLHQQGCEREADHFAGVLGYETHLGHSLIKLGLGQFRPPSDDYIYSLIYHRHPCLVERLQLLHEIPLNTHK